MGGDAVGARALPEDRPHLGAALTPSETSAALVGGVPAEVFTEAGDRTARAYLRASAARVREDLRTWPAAEEVSALLRLDNSEVLRMCSARTLSAIEVDGVVRVAPWQFSDDKSMLPGVHSVLEAMPKEYGPFATNVVMSVPNEVFDGRAPRDLLGTEDGVLAVVAWARYLGLS